jgi:hypothetical protein
MKNVSRLISAGLTGRTFGEWTVGARAPSVGHKAEFWCRCSCGTERSVSGCRLLRGRTKSCGCKANSRNNRPTVPVAARFWAKIEKGYPGQCWGWTGALNSSGYGTLRGSGRTEFRAHRFSYELHHGPIPAGLLVMHSCDNRACVNPAHLSVGTVADNNSDRDAKDRCAVKLNASHVREVRLMASSGNRVAEIADTFGVTPTAIYHVLKGKSRRLIA